MIHGRSTTVKKRESGYALLIIMFMAFLMLISAMMAAPRILTEGKREQEEEMIWRGKQYVRGVKMYYRKMGKFPTSIDDMTKPKTGSLRFMRQAYKDPMNTEDGSWRLIYVGPAGQLVGSLKPQPQGFQFGQAGGFGAPIAGANSAQLGASSSFGTNNSTASVSTPSAPGQSAQNGTAPAGDSSDAQAASPISSTIIGGNIIGVGSKINKKSIMVYDKATRYRLFEFYWDPAKDTANAIQQGMQPGGVPGAQNINGQQPNPQNPTNPQMNPLNPPAQPPNAQPPQDQ